MIGNAKAIIQWLFDQQDAEKLYEIKEKKSKRSLTANAYYWSLLNQLASRISEVATCTENITIKRHL